VLHYSHGEQNQHDHHSIKTRVGDIVRLSTPSPSDIPRGAAFQARSTNPTNMLVQKAFTATILGAYNSLFKVLFIFPSWYLFTIGLEIILSFGWRIPSDLHSYPKENDSISLGCTWPGRNDGRDYHPALHLFPKDTISTITSHKLGKRRGERLGLYRELSSVHSPLLRESRVVFFIPAYLYA